MYRTSPWQRRDFLKTYKAKLAGWKEDVACQCQSEPPRCTCKNYFMRMDKIVEWMEQRQDGEDVTNLDGLLRELKDKIKSLNTYDPFSSSDHLLKGDNRCVTVFAILLELGHGELIYTFKFMNVIDKLLELAPNSNLTELRRDLIQRNIPNASKIIDEFQDAKWAYYSPSLKLSMERNIDSKSVLPFCRRERVNGKGGTASVFEVRVKEEFISDPGLAKALSKSRCIDPVFGQCYQMAVKSFTKDTRDIYEWERRAFAGLQNDENVHIVRCLGYFRHSDCSGAVTYNLLLEFGQMDLDEFWADITNIPPARTDEIIYFWQSLFNVAKAIKNVHEVSKKGGVVDGWHADVKPDNILRVHGKWKLADFGFAKFVERAEGNKEDPEQYIEGGTQAYGAPEVARIRTDGTRTPVQQTIDTWSLGCVFSVAATWVVLGFEGVEQFEMLRKNASRSRNLASDHKITDSFHDGSVVLPQISDWHRYLKNHLRASDTLTKWVLDFIEAKMLLNDPAKRLKSGELCDELDELIGSAKDRNERFLRDGVLKRTADSVKNALLGMEKINSAPSSRVAQDQSRPDPHTSKSVKKSARSSVQSNGAPSGEKLFLEEKRNNDALAINTGDAESPGVHSGDLTESPMSVVSDAADRNSYRGPEPQSRRLLESQITQRTAPGPNLDDQSYTAQCTGAVTTPHQATTDTTDKPASRSSRISTPIAPGKDPERVFELPWDVCKVREKLEAGVPRGLVNGVVFKAKEHIKGPRKDSFLEDFITNRDLVFVIDNATTMRKYWPMVVFTAETLAMKVAGLDDDGYDLRFTMTPKYNKDGRKGANGLDSLKKQLRKADPKNDMPTDMSKNLVDLFNEYRRRKSATLIVLTDGAWQGTKRYGDVREKIVGEALRQAGRGLERHLTIQFVSFGLRYKKELDALDDIGDDKIPDIVDHTSWMSKVDKMIVGSINPNFDERKDENEPNSPLIQLEGSDSSLDLENVCGLFERYNNYSYKSSSRGHRRVNGSITSTNASTTTATTRGERRSQRTSILSQRENP